MRRSNPFLALLPGAFALCLLGTAAQADTVVLLTGARLNGKVAVSSRAVRVENEDGVAVISRSLVREVLTDGVVPGHREARRGGNPTRPAAKDAVSRGTAAGSGTVQLRPSGGNPGPAAGEAIARARFVPPGVSPKLVAALRRPISVEFLDTSLVDALAYLREITDVNLVYDYRELRQDSVPVNLKLNLVPLHQVLDLLLEARGLSWGVVRDVVRIGREAELQRLELRCYDIRDLLMNTEDRVPAATERGREPRRTELRGEMDAQFGWQEEPYGWQEQQGWGGYYEGERRPRRVGWRRYARTVGQTASERAYDLAMLITQTVRPETWAQPAVVWIGPARGRRFEQQAPYERPWDRGVW